MLNLTNYSLSLLLLNCAMHRPMKNSGDNAFGILMGYEKRDSVYINASALIPDYVYQNVTGSEFDFGIDESTEVIDYLGTGLNPIGTFEMFTSDIFLDDDLLPLNQEVLMINSTNFKYKLKILLVITNEPKEKLTINKKYDVARRYLKSKNGELPIEKTLNQQISLLQGHFHQYFYEIRAFKYEKDYMEDMSVECTEIPLTELSPKIPLSNFASETLLKVERGEMTKEKAQKILDEEDAVIRGERQKFILFNEKIYRQVWFENKHDLLKNAEELIIRVNLSNEITSDVAMFKIDFIEDDFLTATEVHENIYIDGNSSVQAENTNQTTFNVEDLIRGYIEDITLCRIDKYPVILLREGLV